MKKEFDLKIDGGTLESIKVDSLNSLIIATYKRDVEEFKNGDILIDAYNEDGAKFISILKDINEDKSGRFSTHIVLDIFDHRMIFDSSNWDHTEHNRLATDEEKQLLFDALKKKGKRWNAETLQVEDIVDEFKRGDILTAVGVGHDKSNMTFIYNHFSKYSGHFEGEKREFKKGDILDHIGCTNVQFGDDIFNGFIEVWHHQSSKEEATANAHLICAAPELLRALIGMTLSMKAHPDYQFGKNQEFIDYVESAEQAINKALGL